MQISTTLLILKVITIDNKNIILKQRLFKNKKYIYFLKYIKIIDIIIAIN